MNEYLAHARPSLFRRPRMAPQPVGDFSAGNKVCEIAVRTMWIPPILVTKGILHTAGVVGNSLG